MHPETLSGVHDGPEQRTKGIGHGLGQLGARCEGAARVPVPDLLREQVNKAYPLEHRALIERILACVELDTRWNRWSSPPLLGNLHRAFASWGIKTLRPVARLEKSKRAGQGGGTAACPDM